MVRKVLGVGWIPCLAGMFAAGSGGQAAQAWHGGYGYAAYSSCDTYVPPPVEVVTTYVEPVRVYRYRVYEERPYVVVRHRPAYRLYSYEHRYAYPRYHVRVRRHHHHRRFGFGFRHRVHRHHRHHRWWAFSYHGD
ncbi:MAG: hypothetical protein D6788_00700 [Planctomycetota bacterium]|nr:MAG: hypothetical protein D6788_00700 [Planctomycetota bacterium]